MSTISYMESGMNIVLPTDKHFQFHQCPAYTTIKSQSVTEMDFGVLEVKDKSNTLWLIELKQFYDDNNPHFHANNPESVDVIKAYTNTFHKNLWHSFAMLAQNRSNTKTCIGLNRFNFETDNLQAIFILNLDGKKKDLLPFQKALDWMARDVKAIFKIKTVRVLSYEQAKSHSVLAKWFKFEH